MSNNDSEERTPDEILAKVLQNRELCALYLFNFLNYDRVNEWMDLCKNHHTEVTNLWKMLFGDSKHPEANLEQPILYWVEAQDIKDRELRILTIGDYSKVRLSEEIWSILPPPGPKWTISLDRMTDNLK